MLVLTRKINEAIVIGESLRVIVLDVRGRKVRLGIEAPRSLLIRREEIPPEQTPPRAGEVHHVACSGERPADTD